MKCTRNPQKKITVFRLCIEFGVAMLVVTVLLYQNSSRCDKKVWDIWDEGEAEVAVNFSKEGLCLAPSTSHC